MDLTSIIGMVLSVTSLFVGDIMEGGNPFHLLHLSSFLIVVPTAMFSAMTATHAKAVRAAFKEFKLIFAGPQINISAKIDELVDLATMARRDGILALEPRLKQMDDLFLKDALSMIVDGRDADSVKHDMETRIEQLEEYYHSAAHYWLLAGESSPTFGLIGAVMGLILALQKLDDPAAMAAGIGGAFTATVTGILSAYAFLGPWGNKMKAKAKDIVREKEMILEGVVAIAQGENPRYLETKLFNYLDPSETRTSRFE